MRRLLIIISRVTLLLTLLLFKSSFANSITEQQLLNQQRIFQQQQEQRRLEEQNKLQIQKAKQIRESKIKKDEIEDKGCKVGDTNCESGKCLRFGKIEVSGNESFSNRYIKRKILNKYIGRCINKDNIESILNSLTRLYINKGYATVIVYFDISKLKSENKFIFIIEEGMVNDIIINNIPIKKEISNQAKENHISEEKFDIFIDNLWKNYQEFRSKSQVFTAFPFIEGKIFNLRDIEMGLDQLNRLSSNNAKLYIKEAKNKNGNYSDVVVNNIKFNGTFLDFSVDNSGNKSTGENLFNITLNQDNLIGINDNLYLRYTQDLDTENGRKYNKLFYGNISAPLGYWTFTASLSYSKYLTTINGFYTTFDTSGSTLTQYYNFDRAIYRSIPYMLNFGTNLEIKDTESFIKRTKSITGSRKSSNINFYLNNIIYTKLGTIIIKPSYQKGLKYFNSKEDTSDLLNIEPKLQYDLLKLYTYYNTKITLPSFKKKMISLNYTMSFDSQYSFDTLYGTNQFSVGGEYTVRGFREQLISGDSGYYVRNDLRINLQQLFSNILAKTYLGIFYDYGYVRNKYKIANDNSNSGYMAGTGLIFGYYGKQWNWSLTYAKALHSPDYSQTRDGLEKENYSLYWRFGGRF